MLAANDFSFLADVNASLNGVATILIIAGLVAIKRKNEALHKALMLSAAAVSALFLASYLTYHLTSDPVKFQGEGALRTIYFAVLISHVVLAAAVPILVAGTIIHGLKDNRAKHRKWAKITAPIWLYVSVTGVVVYYMLYQL